MPSEEIIPIALTTLDRRLLLVVGKGGVGKTTVATALALRSAAAGRRTLIVETDLEDRVSPLLGKAAASGPGAQPLYPNVSRMSVEGRAALEEYLALIVPVRRVLKVVFDSRVYQYFVAAAPGLRELMTIGKVFYEVDQGRWDQVIVDCPATGHALQYLRMPRTAVETFPSGLVHREAERVWGLLSDPERTAVMVVTTAEEMPANETIELCRELDHKLHLPRGLVIVNRFLEPGMTAGEVRAAAGFRKPLADQRSEAIVADSLARALEIAVMAERHQVERERIITETGWKLSTLPFLYREEFGASEVEELARLIGTPETGAAAHAPKRVRGKGAERT